MKPRTAPSTILILALIAGTFWWGAPKVTGSDPGGGGNAISLELIPSDGGDTPRHAMIRGRTADGRILWKADLGMASTVKVASNAKIGAILVGDNRGNFRFQAAPGSQNTVYLINLKTGETLERILPLKGIPETWADQAWQDLTISVSSNELRVRGELFSYPEHPNKVPFSKSFPLPKISQAPGVGGGLQTQGSGQPTTEAPKADENPRAVEW